MNECRRYPTYLRRRQASAYLLAEHGLSYKPGTLMKMASLGQGPKRHYDGRFPLYAIADLDAWVRARVTQSPRRRDHRPVRLGRPAEAHQ
jgi:hypothetical protein